MALALLYRDRGEHERAAPLYRRLLAIHEQAHEPAGVSPQFLSWVALCHNELAVCTELPAGNWSAAEHHFRCAADLFSQVSQPLEAANAELNLQDLFRRSGRHVDLSRIKELTRILEAAGDPRAATGYALLKEVSAGEG
jgi:tetratricopeptide (TPR) repeat protein